MCNTYIGLNLTRGKQMKQVLRVGVMNNFDMTEKEFNALKEYERDDRIIFVNSNAFTKIDARYPSFVTLNPYLEFVEPKGDLSNVKAFRIKVWACDSLYYDMETAKCFEYAVEKHIPILITFMRFKSKESMKKYRASSTVYVWDHGWWRPVLAYREAVRKHFNHVDVYFCDFDGKGCPSCMNCVKLNTPKDDYDYYSIASLDLKESGDNGVCKYNCPDCFAKKCLRMNKGKPALNQIKYNRKQLGKFFHI